KRNSLRPIRKEYWIEKGYSEEDAIRLAIDKKDSNNKLGAKRVSERDRIERQRSSPTSIEYWLVRGYSEEEGRQQIEERKPLHVFSKEKCIKKYGEDEGIRIWQERQDK